MKQNFKENFALKFMKMHFLKTYKFDKCNFCTRFYLKFVMIFFFFVCVCVALYVRINSNAVIKTNFLPFLFYYSYNVLNCNNFLKKELGVRCIEKKHTYLLLNKSKLSNTF